MRERGKNDTAASIEYLLPVMCPEASQPLDSENESDNEEDVLNVYRQTVPLLHPMSTAATKTLGKIVHDHELVKRILQRNTHQLSTEKRKHVDGASEQRIEFIEVCEQMMIHFDPQVRETREISFARVKPLLGFYQLQVDDVAYRQWEQALPKEARKVSISMFAQACLLWFNEKFIIEHFRSVHGNQHVANALLSSTNIDRLGKCHSAPQLHPFDILTQQSERAQAFDFEKYSKNPPQTLKTKQEINTLKSEAIIHATHELRRKSKILNRTSSCTELLPLSSSVTTGDGGSHITKPHDRLYNEQLAKHVLSRCVTRAIAPSNRPRLAQSLAKIRQMKREQALHKQLRQEREETARAFSASVAMISRHVQNEELHDIRELRKERQRTIVDEQKHWNRVQKAHYCALSEEKKTMQLRDVQSMKTITKEELELVRNYLNMRREMLARNKPPFALSASTSTLFQQPPDILAAKATAKTQKEKKHLIQIEKEHLEHVRSLQLLDFVYEKKRALLEATKQKTQVSLVDVSAAITEEELPIQEAEIERLWQELVASGNEMLLLPLTNSPPAALRYFGTSRPVLLPPFSSSASRDFNGN